MRRRLLPFATLLVALVLSGACGGGESDTPEAAGGAHLTVATPSDAALQAVSRIYGEALEKAGVEVTYTVSAAADLQFDAQYKGAVLDAVAAEGAHGLDPSAWSRDRPGQQGPLFGGTIRAAGADRPRRTWTTSAPRRPPRGGWGSTASDPSQQPELGRATYFAACHESPADAPSTLRAPEGRASVMTHRRGRTSTKENPL